MAFVNVQVSELPDAKRPWVEEGIQSIVSQHGWEKDWSQILDIVRKAPQLVIIRYAFTTVDPSSHPAQLKGFAVLRKRVNSTEIQSSNVVTHFHVSWFACGETNQGHGLAIMNHIVQLSREAGHRRLTLTHRKNNPRLKRFYERVAEVCLLNYEVHDREEIRLFISYTW